MLLAYVEMAGDGGGAMSVLRMLRVLRILKMTKSMASFQSLIASVSDTLPSWGFLALLISVLWFVFSLMGMQLFGGAFPTEYMRTNFNSFPEAMLTTFTLIIAADW